MKITLKARFIVTVSAIILAIANFLAYRVLVFSSTLPDSNFLIFNIVSLAIFIVIVNILFIPEIKHYKFDLDKIKEYPETYRSYINKLGATPLKALIKFLLLTTAMLIVANIFLKSSGINSKVINFYTGLMCGIGMVSSSFIYVIFDRLVSRTLLTSGYNEYPENIKSNRQKIKSIIIPLFICIMSVVSTFFLSLLAMTTIPPEVTNMPQYLFKTTFLPLIIIVIFIGLLIYMWSNSTESLYNNVITRLKEMVSKDKDLTTRITISSIDELGLISDRINKFSDIIGKHLIETKAMVEIQNKNQQELVNSIAITSNNVHEIDDRIEETIKLAEHTDNIVKLTLTTGKELIQNSSSVADQVEIQTSNVAESSAAVEEMIASVKEVTKRTNTVKERTLELTSDFNISKTQIDSTIQSVSNVVTLSQSLIDINKIISSIAARTNLLAMNAAIEAAHAGDAGRGFSVVADEIRKLAENTSTQTKTSSENLKKVLDEIETSLSIANQTGKSFDKMKQSLTVVEQETLSIAEAMEEHDKANTEVLEQLSHTNQLALRLNDISTKLTFQGNSMLDYLEELETASHTSLTNAKDIKSFNEEVTLTMQNLNEISLKTEEAHNKTVELVGTFKLE